MITKKHKIVFLREKKPQLLYRIFFSFVYRLLNEPSSTLINSETQTVIPKSVYDYATIVRQSLKTPRQNKLDSDVATVLGTSDPPPGFGFLHPQVYYLEQTRPVPLEPLQASI